MVMLISDILSSFPLRSCFTKIDLLVKLQTLTAVSSL